MDEPPILVPPHEPRTSLQEGPPSNVEMLDRICAGLVGISGLCTGLGVFFISGLFAFLGKTPNSDPTVYSFMQGFQQFMGVLIAIFLVLAAFEIAVAYGLWRARRWAFIAAITFYGLSFIGSMKSAPVALVSAAIVVYCAFRISGNFGPRPL